MKMKFNREMRLNHEISQMTLNRVSLPRPLSPSESDKCERTIDRFWQSLCITFMSKLLRLMAKRSSILGLLLPEHAIELLPTDK